MSETPALTGQAATARVRTMERKTGGRHGKIGAFSALGRHRGIPLFSVLGIRIVADYSWFLIVALIAVTLTIGWFPSALPGRSTVQYVFLALITSFFFFASVLLHELSHSVVATLSGIPVKRITLFLFGGVAEISREPSDPRTELRVALAGPVASAILAAVFWAVVRLMGPHPARPGLQTALVYLALANTVLLVFNLIPGLPLDGGRVLRAVLWRATRNLRRATQVASLAGKALAALLIVAGLVLTLSGGERILPGLWAIFIALFLRQAADTSYRQLVMREALAGVRIATIMTRDVVTAPPGISLAELIDTYLLRHHFTCYPVIEDGRPIGIITIKAVKHVPRGMWGTTSVAQAMIPLKEETSLSPDDDIPTAIQKMAATGLGRLPVIDEGRLVGIVSRRDIMNYLEIRSDLGS
jgi:Zn-dependent protease/predicted transcriptional regulator